MLRLLEVDLSTGEIEKSTLEENYSKYLGGRGLAVALLSDSVKPDVTPLSPENKVIFSTGALISSRIPMSGRSNATSVSPLTNTIFSSNVGGMFGNAMASRDLEVLMISGSSEEPVYLLIDDNPSIHRTAELWGKDVFATTDILIEEHGVKEGNVACIGPAGENLNFFGNIMNQKHRTFGRGGLGAVLGSKKLKAVVFKGTKMISDPKYKDLSTSLKERIKNIKSKLKTQGTSAGIDNAKKNSAMPTRYFSTNLFEHADDINGEKMEQHKVKSGTCFSCPVACKMIETSERYGIITDGPEYETLIFQGSNLGIGDIEAVIKSNDLCDRFGLDTISSGNIIGAVMEASSLGKIEYDISWGEGEMVHRLLEDMGRGRGFGAELQKGTGAFCDKYGIESLTVKGLDFPGHDGRALHGMALGYATSNRGADHLYSSTYRDEYNHPKRQDIRGKAELVIRNENRNAVLDSLGICKFSTSFYRDEEYLAIISAYLDREVTMEEFQAVGSGIVDMERVFNNKRGFDSKDDVLPDRVSVPNLESELQNYYRLRGWTADGKVV